MSYLFISDLHLDENRPDITRGFIKLLANLPVGIERLYILGDFFEVWLGDDHETPFNAEIIKTLAEISLPKYIMHGNRDFLLGQEFCNATGCKLLPDPSIIDIGGEPVLLMHGDSLCTRDEAYMKLRAMLRSTPVQLDLLSKSLEERALIASNARTQSKQHTRETAEDIMDVTLEEVVRVMTEQGVGLLIHGHTHRPATHDLVVAGQPAQRIVLGDWDKHGWYLELDETQRSLVSFPI